MNSPFTGAFDFIDDTGLPATQRAHPADYSRWVREMLSGLRAGDRGILRLRVPRATAAFSPQDTTHEHYVRVRELALEHGFHPVERGTGGRLTMFDEGSLAVTLLWPQAEPQAQTLQRYDVFASAIAEALAGLGIDARVGELPQEYCPGKYSINAAGRVKLVGVAQRMNSHCVQMGAIIAVDRSDAACAAIGAAYQAMGLPFDPQTYGAIRELHPAISYRDVSESVAQSMKRIFSAK